MGHDPDDVSPRSYAAILLAAGHARRFGGDKLSARFRGAPLLSHALAAARAAAVERVILVGRGPVEGIEATPPVTQVTIASDGLAQSLAAGLAAAGDVAGAFVFLGDMPLVPHAMAARLADALGDGFAALPRYDRRPGHPVLLARRAFATIMALRGDEGAGRLLRERADVVWLDTSDAGVVLDVDRLEDLDQLEDLDRRDWAAPIAD